MLLIDIEWVEISLCIIIVFAFFFFEVLDDAVGNRKKDYLDQKFKYVIGEYNNSYD